MKFPFKAKSVRGVGKILYARFKVKKKSERKLAFPYTIHPQYQVEPDIGRLKPLKLVGDNWVTSPSLPIAVSIGFNDWKLGFTSTYLHEYRTAFTRRKISSFKLILLLARLRKISSTLIIWGYTEPSRIIPYVAKALGFRIVRLEDGFIRSVELGANHSTPYSLTLDDDTLYFDARSASRLERILNSDTRIADPEILSKARRAVDFITENNLSKYNRESIGEAYRSYRKRDVVLVIGQVPNDASLRFGNPDKWTSERLVSLARQENPSAEVIYRPHPDVYNRPKFYNENVEQIEAVATILPPSVPMMDILSSAQKVYTISSLVGIEAIIRNIPVVTVGLPFYAGWGLTDDKCNPSHPAFGRRRRRLTVDQLAAGAFLLYPRYLADLHDPDAGLTVACMRILGERLFIKAPFALPSEKGRSEFLKDVSASKDWAYLLQKDVFTKLKGEEIAAILRDINVPLIFSDNQARIFQVFLICRLAGMIPTFKDLNAFLRRVRTAVQNDVFNEALLALWNNQPHVSLLPHFAWLLEENYIAKDAYDILGDALRLSAPPDDAEGHDSMRANDRVFMDGNELSAVLSLVQFSFRNRRLDDAYAGSLKLLLNNKYHAECTGILMAIASLRFDFNSSVNLAEFELSTGAPNHRARDLSRIAEDCRFHSNFHEERFIAASFAATAIAPDSVANMMLLAERVESRERPYDFGQLYLKAMDLDNEASLEKARAWVVFERPEMAIPLVVEVIERDGVSLPALIVLSQAYSYLREYEKAKSVIIDAISKYEHVNAYREAMRLAVMMDDIAWGEELIEAVSRRKLDVGEMSLRKIYNGARRIHEALLTHRDVSPHDDIRIYYPEHYTDGSDVENDFSGQRLFFVTIFGPGDEIRTAQIYPEIQSDPSFGQFTIACDPRLQEMMRRSFPAIDFTPVARVLRHGKQRPIEEYKELPAYDLRYILDNAGQARMLECDRAVLATDLIAKYRKSYNDFSGGSYLRADPVRVAEYKQRLHTTKILVGVNWRSSVSSFSRNEHYLSIEEISPIFDVEGIQFVNLQYDECDREIQWVEERYPGKLINFVDLDQFDDIDGVAGLMTNLDLVIAPATTVAELAGALGVNTWLLSNSAELDGRKLTEDDPTDIWHNSMRHIEGDVRGSKESLVASLLAELSRFSLENRDLAEASA